MQEVLARGGKVMLMSDEEGLAEAGRRGLRRRSTLPDVEPLRHAAPLRRSGAAAGLSHRRRQRHRRRPAAQPGQERDGGVTAPITNDSLKRAAAERAVEFVRDGMKLGLGTGTTAEAFLELLADNSVGVANHWRDDIAAHCGKGARA